MLALVLNAHGKVAVQQVTRFAKNAESAVGYGIEKCSPRTLAHAHGIGVERKRHQAEFSGDQSLKNGHLLRGKFIHGDARLAFGSTGTLGCAYLQSQMTPNPAFRLQKRT